MKKSIIFAVVFLVSTYMLYATAYITLQSGDNYTFHSSVHSAYEEATDGDIIIIPAGLWSVPEIKKSISIVGTGYDVRYSNGTGLTIIPSIEIFASSVVLEGLFIQGNINLQDATDTPLSNLLVSRCRFDRLTQLANNTQNLIIKECVLNSIGDQADDWKNLIISNSFFEGKIHYIQRVNFDNCVFFAPELTSLIIQCQFKNCIFTHWSGDDIDGYWSSGNTFLNNIFTTDAPLSAGVVLKENNKTNVPLSSIFNTLPNKEEWNYDFQFKYSLKSDSPAKNAGLDGTDCGVWGGAYPWKENAVSMYPHIKKASVESATKSNGKLRVEFNVEAQTK